MAQYVQRRLVGMVIVMFIVATIVFVIAHVIPGDPAGVMLGSDATAADIAALRHRLGLDVPLPLQYLDFLRDAASLRLGDSIFLNRSVMQALGERAPLTLQLTLMAAGLAIGVGVPVGVLSAISRGSVLDQTVTALSMTAASLPSFWAAINCSDVLTVAFGEKSLRKEEGSIYPEGTAWFDPAAPGYNQGSQEKAAALLKQAGYRGEPIRILTSVQYDYQFKTAQIIQQNLTDAGFKIDLVVTDWATILQRRQNPDEWEAFITGHGVVPEPSSITVFNPSYPGWWDTPDKRAALDAFVTESDPAKRVPLWHKLQAQFYIDVPTIKIGAGFTTFGASKRISGYYPGIWPCFWNTKLT